jgi:hypothetical protein
VWFVIWATFSVRIHQGVANYMMGEDVATATTRVMRAEAANRLVRHMPVVHVLVKRVQMWAVGHDCVPILILVCVMEGRALWNATF